MSCALHDRAVQRHLSKALDGRGSVVEIGNGVVLASSNSLLSVAVGGVDHLDGEENGQSSGRVK